MRYMYKREIKMYHLQKKENMKKVVYSVAILAFAFVLTSCSKDDDHNVDNTAQDVELRAQSLGFADANAYKSSVAEQCAAGNHENCDILTDGTHRACGYADHAGKNHDGTEHNGTDHGVHDANGHSHSGSNHDSSGHGNHNGKH